MTADDGYSPRPRGRSVLAAGAVRRAATTAALVATLAVGGDAPAEQAAAPARVERVRYSADGGTTRVIVVLSRPVPYEVRILPGEAARGSERRLVIDFSNARLGPGAVEPIGVEDGLLRRIRTGQFTARTARVVLDLASITGHTVTSQSEPNRVVVDITGRPGPPLALAPDDATTAGGSPGLGRAPADATTVGRPAAAKRAPAAPETERAAAARGPAPAEAPAPAERAVAERTVPAEHAAAAGPPAQAAPAGPTGDGSDRRERVAPALRPKPWRIVLDPGHGGSDPGARGINGLLEKNVVLAIAKKLKVRLEDALGAEVLLTRTRDMTRSLAERTAFANANSADLFVSIHGNADAAGTLRGIETYTLNNTNERATMRLAKMENGPAIRTGRGDLTFILSDMVQSGKEEESIALAQRLHYGMLTHLRTRYSDVSDLGVKKGPFYVLVGAYMPCVLVETSFLTHPMEGRRLATATYQTEVAEGLFRGIASFLADTRLAKTL